MRNQPVSETNHGLARTGKEILSIQLRPDGLSFASWKEGNIESVHIDIPAEYTADGFDYVFSSPLWPDRAFTSVWISVPTQYAVLIPAELNRADQYALCMNTLGYPEDSHAHILPLICPAERVLLHAVCDSVMRPLSDKYGNTVHFFHPLYVNLAQTGEKETILQVDCAGGYGNITLNSGDELLFADVFPLENEAALLLAVNRIIVANKVGALRIVCSGEDSQRHVELFNHHYRNVTVHPDSEQRNLLFPFRCE